MLDVWCTSSTWCVESGFCLCLGNYTCVESWVCGDKYQFNLTQSRYYRHDVINYGLDLKLQMRFIVCSSLFNGLSIHQKSTRFFNSKTYSSYLEQCRLAKCGVTGCDCVLLVYFWSVCLLWYFISFYFLMYMTFASICYLCFNVELTRRKDKWKKNHIKV